MLTSSGVICSTYLALASAAAVHGPQVGYFRRQVHDDLFRRGVVGADDHVPSMVTLGS